MPALLLAAALLGSLATAIPTQPHGYGPPHGWGPSPSGSAPSGYASSSPLSSGAPTVSLKNGTVVGEHNANYNQDFFLGVPFAQPPVGELRFRNPQSINSTYNSTLQATAYAPECVGYGGDDLGYPVSEDCLCEYCAQIS